MVEEELSVEEQHIAACTSYAYWAYEQYLKNAEPPPSEADHDVVRQSLRIQMAMREAHRHYVGQNHQYQNTVTRLKQTIQWRKDTRIDLLKIAFTSATTLPTTTTIPIRWTDSSTTQLLQRYERWIPSDLQIPAIVFGFSHTSHPALSTTRPNAKQQIFFIDALGFLSIACTTAGQHWNIASVFLNSFTNDAGSKNIRPVLTADIGFSFWILNRRKLVPYTTNYELRVDHNSEFR